MIQLFLKNIILSVILVAIAIAMTISGNLNPITLLIFIVGFLVYMIYLYNLSKKTFKGDVLILNGIVSNVRKKGISLIDKYYLIGFKTEDGNIFYFHSNNKKIALGQSVTIVLKDENSILPNNGFLFIKDYISVHFDLIAEN